MRHATAQELEEYVSGQGSGWLEEHCETCSECAVALVREARLEVALRAMGSERRCGTSAPPPAPRPLPMRTSFVALAAAACVAFAVAAVRLPAVPAAPAVLYADAGGAQLVQPVVPPVVDGSPSGGTP